MEFIDKELNKKVKEFLKAKEREMIGEKIKRAKQNKKEREGKNDKSR